MKNNDATELSRNFEQFGYYLDRKFESIINLSIELGKPLFLEGFPGVGKTELAKVIAKKSNVELIRLQCYEGIDINQAVYDWNYSKQIVSIRLNEMNQKEEINKVKLSDIYSAEYLIERPILSCIHLSSQQRPVLLIDEIDRADESFEAFLLEFLSEFAITIPEIGTLNCKNKPIVIITSNRTREINDALKRRCFYHWIDYPSKEIELAILENKVNDFSQKLAHEVLNFVNKLRNQDLKKKPGISETIDWYNGLTKLNLSSLDNEKLSESLGLLLKNYSDIEKFRNNNPDFLE
ncbi:MAG: MoxR family ATPase [Hydrogenophilales bacterium]